MINVSWASGYYILMWLTASFLSRRVKVGPGVRAVIARGKVARVMALMNFILVETIPGGFCSLLFAQVALEVNWM